MGERTWKPGTQPAENTTQKTTGDLQYDHDQPLHDYLNALNEFNRNMQNFFAHVRKLPDIKTQVWNSANFPQEGVLRVSLNGIPIRSIYVENGMASGTLNVYAGSNGSGSMPLASVTKGTWQIKNINQVSEVSFATPAASTGYIRITVYESLLTPNTGSVV